MTGQAQFEAMEKRLNRLERRQQLQRLWGMVALLLVTAVGVAAATLPQSSTIEAERIILRYNGTKIIELGPSQAGILSGGPTLRFFDRNGDETVLLEASYQLGGGRLRLQDKDGFASLSHPGAEGSQLAMHAEGQGAIILTCLEDGPSLTLRDSDFVERAILGATRLRILSSGSTEIRTPASLVLFDEEGNVIWRVPQ